MPAFKGRVLVLAGSDSGSGDRTQANTQNVTPLGSGAANATPSMTV